MISPCVSKCIVDHRASMCISCGRSLWEIEQWQDWTEEERRDSMVVAACRLADYNQNNKQDEADCFDITGLYGGSDVAAV